jgi:broad specificity phosphatase PhoE
MKIYFVRHGQTVNNKKNIMTGWIDSPLTNKGIEQAKKTALEIPSGFSEIYCSDLIRCKQTAEIINQKLNLPIKYDARLRERNFGFLEGKSWDEIGLDLKELDTNQKYNYHPFGGESVKDVRQRLFSFIDDIRKKEIKGKILIVAHGGLIRLLHNLLNNQVHEEIHNSSIHEFEFPDTI